MNCGLFALILLNLNSLMCSQFDLRLNNYETLSTGLKIISDKILARHTINFNMVFVSHDHATNDFRDSFMKLFMENAKFRVRQQLIEDVRKITTKSSRKFSIMTIHTFEDFKKIKTRLTADNFDFQGYFIFPLVRGKIDEIQDIFNELWDLQILNVIVIFKEIHGHLPVLTFFPFRSSIDCSNTTPVIINEFINGTFTRGLSSLFPNKVDNLQQCEIRVASSDSMPPNNFARTTLDGQKKMFGRDFEVVSALSESLNFKLRYSLLSHHGCLMSHNGREGVLGSLYNNRSDLVILDCWLKLSRLEIFESSTTYFTEKIVMAYPMESEVTSFEKLFSPLSLTTWILLIVYLTIGVVSIFIIRFLSYKIQNFVIGEKVKYPYLNMLIGFVGQSQNRLPGNNFARFLLMNFLLFTLVMRTAYQGEMYEVMQSDIKHSEPKTIYEMYRRGYKFHVLDFISDIIFDISKFTIV